MIDENYYAAGMEYYRERYDNSVFVVASDNMTWCKENFNSSDILFIGKNRV